MSPWFTNVLWVTCAHGCAWQTGGVSIWDAHAWVWPISLQIYLAIGYDVFSGQFSPCDELGLWFDSDEAPPVGTFCE